MNSKGAPLRRRHEEETEKAARDNFRGFTKTHRTIVLDKGGKVLLRQGACRKAAEAS